MGVRMSRRRSKNAVDDRRVAVYVRKSKITESGKSIEMQKERCAALAQAQFGVDAVDVLVYEDEGKSGFYADRPQYRKMLKDIEGNRIKAVICYKIDRISRRAVDLLNLIQQMEQKGIAFVSVSDRELDTSTRTGKIMISMLSAIAEFERDIIAERITDNMYELAKEGRWLGGKCPLGFYSHKEKIGKTTVNHLKSVEEEQRAVLRLFELFFELGSLTGTAAKLNDEGFKTSNGNDFTLVAVKNILQNPVYAIADEDMRSYFTSFDVPIWADDADFDGVRGIMAYNKTEQFKEIDADSTALDPKYTQRSLKRDVKEWVISVGKHKGMIRGADWIRVQNLVADIATGKSARPKESSKALLSGLVRCVECGSKMFVRAESGRYNPDGSLRFRYVCDKKYRKKGGCEGSPNVKGWELDNFVVEQICAMNMGDNAFFDELLSTKDTLLSKSKETEKEQYALRKQISQLDADMQSQISNLRTAPEGVKRAIYADIEAMNEERNTKQVRLDEIQGYSENHDNQMTDIEKAKQTILDFPRLVELVGYEGKLQLLRRILEGVVVKDEKAHIFLKGCHVEINTIFYTP